MKTKVNIKMNKIGIVTVTYNSASVIDDFMTSILKQTHTDFILYVIDNNSTDNTLGVVSNYLDSRIKCVEMTTNIGFAGGSNVGIKMALGDNMDYIMLLNNDTVFDEHLLKTLLTNLQNYKPRGKQDENDKYDQHYIHQLCDIQQDVDNIDVVTPKIMYHNPATKIWYAGGSYKRFFEFITIHNGEGETDVEQYNTPILCDFAPMCCVLMKKECFLKNGYLDEKFFVYSEDADWFYRAKKIGIKLLYLPDAVLYHKVSSLTGGSTSKFSANYGTRNKVYLIRKNFSGIKKNIYLIEYLCWIIIGTLMRKFSFREFKWKIKGFFDGVFL